MRLRLAALAAVVVVVTAFGIPAHATYGARVTADEPQYLLSAISLADDGDLDISDELADEAYRPFHPVDLPPQTLALDDTGRHVSPHDPLLPVLLAVPVHVGGWAAAKATLALAAGALAALMAWTAIRRFGVRPPVAAGVVGIFACSAPLATFATQIYPEVPAALAVTAAVAAITGRLGRGGLAVLILSLTALPWLSIKYVPVGAALLVVALWRLRARPPAGVVTLTALAMLAVAYFVVHHRVYGGWTSYASGDEFAGAGELSVMGTTPDYLGRSRRVVGLLVDSGFGLAAWMPAFLFLPFAVGLLARRRPPGWQAVLVPLAAGWTVASFVALTMHGWWWPGRQVVVVVPLAVIAVAWTLDTVPALRRPFVIAAVLGIVTWAWTTVEAVTRRHVLVVDFDQTSNPWYRLWRLAMPDGRTEGVATDALTVVWIAVVVGITVRGWRLEPQEDLKSSQVGSPTISTKESL